MPTNCRLKNFGKCRKKLLKITFVYCPTVLAIDTLMVPSVFCAETLMAAELIVQDSKIDTTRSFCRVSSHFKDTNSQTFLQIDSIERVILRHAFSAIPLHL
jgi:hypothetical protein